MTSPEFDASKMDPEERRVLLAKLAAGTRNTIRLADIVYGGARPVTPIEMYNELLEGEE